MKRKYPIVAVTWEDTANYRGWNDVETSQKGTGLIVETVGYLIGKDDKYLRVAHGVCEENKTASEVTVIPRAVVKRNRRLR